MLQTLANTGPIYLVIALGFRAIRFNVFGKADMRVLGTYVVRGHADEGKWHRILMQTLVQLSRNPVILSIVGGFAVSMTGIQITGVLARSINMLAMSSAAGSLLVIGGTLVGLKTAGMRRDVSAIAAGKLLLHPLAAGLMMWLLPPTEPALRATAVVFAAVPMLSIYPNLAQRYGYEDICAAAQLLATVLSFVTISVVLWFLGSAIGWV